MAFDSTFSGPEQRRVAIRDSPVDRAASDSTNYAVQLSSWAESNVS
jgi:hypothetical protein